MRNMLLIARREYLEQVRGRAFRMTTSGLPAVFALIVGVGYLSSLGLGANRHMAVAASDPALANEIRNQLVGDKEAKAKVDVVAPATPEQRAALVKQVEAKALDGVLWVDTPPGAMPTATYTSQSSGDFITMERLKSALNHAMLDERLTGGGMKQAAADALVDGVSIETFQVKKDGSVVRSNAAGVVLEGLRDGSSAFDDHHDLWHERGALDYPGEDVAHL